MSDNVLNNWLNTSCLIKSNQSYIEKIYKDFLNNPESVDHSWHKIFNQLSLKQNELKIPSTSSRQDACLHLLNNNTILNKVNTKKNIDKHLLYLRVSRLINAFRTHGHQYAILDPLGLYKKTKNNILELKNYNFTEDDFNQKLDTKSFDLNQGFMTISEIYKLFNEVYCNTIGIEYMHILNSEIITWIQNYFESKKIIFNFSITEKTQFLKEIIAAEGLEQYLGTKFPGAKRFSLEGGDVLIPMLKELIRYSVYNHNTQEIFLGMAHRGRLNVLINIFGKNPQDLFNEFLNKNQINKRSGDVKYHQGFHTDITINGNIIRLSLLSNPSHLEIITPIVIGSTRARIDQLFQTSIHHTNEQYNTILPVIIHGDAAISGQGIVQETFNMSKTRAYKVGGAIHIVINNQIGFTTSNIYDMRSTQHCTDIAKMIQAPIFHVNGDDVNAVISVIRIALEFRNRYKSDVIVDLICYRRHGHNEADEPSVTQPIMYKKINRHPTLSTIYSNYLNQNHNDTANIDSNNINKAYREQLEKKQCVLTKWQPIYIYSEYHKNNSFLNFEKYHDSKINNKKYLQKIASHINTIPSNIIMHNRVKKVYHERFEMALEHKLFDWGSAETLAYATLLDQGISIRLSGEDASRGTFFHRHAIIYDQDTGTEYIPLMNIKNNQKGSFLVWDSVLSEAAALAFEYGYSNIISNTLVIWEAQFGDFANGAQVVIDQFISSGEQKWDKSCGLVMLLPHGFEGQGPEHSSARIERYLQLCSEYNMQICIPSTPAQIYHILRQQIINNIKKPLVIMSPKSLLRHPMVKSTLDDLAYGSFQKVFNEIDNNLIFTKFTRIIICSGKIYYDLLNARNNKQQHYIGIIRIEQLYPFPYSEIKNILSNYTHVKDFIWCQEEPKNQGAWYYIQNCFSNIISQEKDVILNYIGRPESAAPAVGYLSVHQQQQKKIIDDALNLN